MTKENHNEQEQNECPKNKKGSYEKPFLISLNTSTNEIGHNVFSFQTFEGGSYPTTHGPS